MANFNQKRLKKAIAKAKKKGGSIPGHGVKTNVGDPTNKP